MLSRFCLVSICCHSVVCSDLYFNISELHPVSSGHNLQPERSEAVEVEEQWVSKVGRKRTGIESHPYHPPHCFLLLLFCFVFVWLLFCCCCCFCCCFLMTIFFRPFITTTEKRLLVLIFIYFYFRILELQ